MLIVLLFCFVSLFMIVYCDFFVVLQVVGFVGEICMDYVNWIVQVIDNLIYQCLLQVVICFVYVDDVQLLVWLLVEFVYCDVVVVVCGGGIGINGQLLIDGIVVDLLCNMNWIFEINV